MKVKEFISLLFPILFSNIVVVLGSVADTILLSNYSDVHLTAISIALSVYMIVYVLGYGLLQGVFQELAEEKGRTGKYEKYNDIFFQGLFIVLAFSIVGGIAMNHISFLFTFFDATKQVVDLANFCLFIFSFELVIKLLIRILFIKAQILGKSSVILYANIFFLIVKVTLSYLLINGIVTIGSNSSGVYGAVISTLVSEIFTLLGFYYFYINKSPLLKTKISSFQINTFLQIIKVGIPTSIIMVIDVFVFMSVAIFALPLGTMNVAAHQIVSSLFSLLYIIPSSISSVFSISISQYLGEDNKSDADNMSFLAIKVIFITSIFSSLSIFLFKEQIVEMFSKDTNVTNIVYNLISIGCLYHVVDALLCIIVTILRCWNITTLPMIIYGGTLIFIGLGLGNFLAFNSISIISFKISAIGISSFWLCSSVAYFIATILCFICFRYRYLKLVR